MLHTTVLSEVRRHLILHCSTQQQETSGRGEKASFRHLRKQGALLLQAVHYQQIFQDCDRSLVPCKIHVTAVLINLTHSIFQKQFYDPTYSTTCSSIESVHKQYLTAPYIACICSKESYHNQVTCETVRTPLVSYTRKDCRHLRTMFSFFFKKKKTNTRCRWHHNTTQCPEFQHYLDLQCTGTQFFLHVILTCSSIQETGIWGKDYPDFVNNLFSSGNNLRNILEILILCIEFLWISISLTLHHYIKPLCRKHFPYLTNAKHETLLLKITNCFKLAISNTLKEHSYNFHLLFTFRTMNKRKQNHCQKKTSLKCTQSIILLKNGLFEYAA